MLLGVLGNVFLAIPFSDFPGLNFNHFLKVLAGSYYKKLGI